MCIMMLRNFPSFAGPNIILNGLTHMLSIHQCKWSHVMLSCPRWWPDPGACALVTGVWVLAQVEGPGIHHHGADTAYCPGKGVRDVICRGVEGWVLAPMLGCRQCDWGGCLSGFSFMLFHFWLTSILSLVTKCHNLFRLYHINFLAGPGLNLTTHGLTDDHYSYYWIDWRPLFLLLDWLTTAVLTIGLTDHCYSHMTPSVIVVEEDVNFTMVQCSWVHWEKLSST